MKKAGRSFLALLAICTALLVPLAAIAFRHSSLASSLQLASLQILQTAFGLLYVAFGAGLLVLLVVSFYALRSALDKVPAPFPRESSDKKDED